MRWFVVYLAALAMSGGYTLSKGLGADSARAQPVPQTPTGNAVPVTADNFNRAETDMYFGKRVKRGGVGNLSHSRELYLTDSPVVRPNRDTLYSGAVFDYDAGPVTITLPDAGNRFMSMQVVDEGQYNHAVYYGAGRYTVTREEMGTRYGLVVTRILVNPEASEDMNRDASDFGSAPSALRTSVSLHGFNATGDAAHLPVAGPRPRQGRGRMALWHDALPERSSAQRQFRPTRPPRVEGSVAGNYAEESAARAVGFRPPVTLTQPLPFELAL